LSFFSMMDIPPRIHFIEQKKAHGKYEMNI
jgi:hypothetical protein